MFAQIRKWFALLDSTWFGSVIAYGSIFVTVYLAVWAIIEPLDVPGKLEVFSSTLDRRLLHILLAVLIACHLTLLLDLVHKWKRSKQTILEQMSNGVVSTDKSVASQPEIMEYLKKPLTISAERRNPYSIEDSSFLKWSQCTILIGAYVPDKGQGLRDAPGYRYLLAHHTGKLPGSSYKAQNLFSLRYSPDNQWELAFRNSRDTNKVTTLKIDDCLEAGWHQFAIAWNPSGLLFFIDGGERGQKQMSSRFSSYWPEQVNSTVSVGAWLADIPYEDSYCETEIYQLWICRRFLNLSDQIVIEHLDLLNQSAQ